MRVDVSNTRYHEALTAPGEFDRVEIRRLRLLLRRLRFLETQVNSRAGSEEDSSAGAQFAEWEVEALEWVLSDLGYLEVRDA